MYQMKRAAETYKEMKNQFEEDKRIICVARNDVQAITSLLAKMNQLPIISGSEVKDGQLDKLIKEIQNYNIIAGNLTIEINLHDQQLEAKRRRDIENEVTIEKYNKIYGEVEALAKKRDTVKNTLKNKEDQMTLLTSGIQLSELDIDFIEDRLETRAQLFEEYMKTSNITDTTLKQISVELGNHIGDIKRLTTEFISYEVNVANGEHIQGILKQIKEKEAILDNASELLKIHDSDNSNLKQLFDAIRLNNVAHVFELIINNFNKIYRDLSGFKEEIVKIRNQVQELENKIKNKEEQLEQLLAEIVARMKCRTLTFPRDGSNKELVDYLTNLNNSKKENQALKNLTQKIKDRGTEVIDLCRKIIAFQETQNQKLSLEISMKTDVIKGLQERYCNLHNEVRENTKLVLLQTKLEHFESENEHLLFMNGFMKSNYTRVNNENQEWRDRFDLLEAQNTELIGLNIELSHANVDLRNKLEKMENYVRVVRRNLSQLEIDIPEEADHPFSL